MKANRYSSRKRPKKRKRSHYPPKAGTGQARYKIPAAIKYLIWAVGIAVLILLLTAVSTFLNARLHRN